jgi:Mor family transcriptional regulator
MKYLNAAEVLPKDLLIEIQKHIKGEVLYIPKDDVRIRWGEKNGSKSYFENRNNEIKQLYKNGCSLEEISCKYRLAHDTVRKILYKK